MKCETGSIDLTNQGIKIPICIHLFLFLRRRLNWAKRINLQKPWWGRSGTTGTSEAPRISMTHYPRLPRALPVWA